MYDKPTAFGRVIGNNFQTPSAEGEDLGNINGGTQMTAVPMYRDQGDLLRLLSASRRQVAALQAENAKLKKAAAANN